MSFQTRKSFVHLQNTIEDILDENLVIVPFTAK